MNNYSRSMALVEVDAVQIKACVDRLMAFIFTGQAWPGQGTERAIEPKKTAKLKHAFAEIQAMVRVGVIALSFEHSCRDVPTSFVGELEANFIIQALHGPGSLSTRWLNSAGASMVLRAAVQMAESLK
jgi:hypothetical protein